LILKLTNVMGHRPWR